MAKSVKAPCYKVQSKDNPEPTTPLKVLVVLDSRVILDRRRSGRGVVQSVPELCWGEFENGMNRLAKTYRITEYTFSGLYQVIGGGRDGLYAVVFAEVSAWRYNPTQCLLCDPEVDKRFLLPGSHLFEIARRRIAQ